MSRDVRGASAHVLRFLAHAVAPRSVVAVGADADARAALETVVGHRARSAPAGEPPRFHDVESPAEVPADAGMVYLGQGARWAEPSPGVLIVSVDADAVPDAPDRVSVPLRLAPADEGACLTVAVAGGSISPAALAELDAIADADRRRAPTAPIARDIGRLLFVLARSRRARHAVELGTSTGAATVWLAAALSASGGSVVSVERDSARRTAAARHLARAGLAGIVELRIGEADRVIPRLGGPFDLAFLDEDPVGRDDRLLALLPHLAPGALVVSHGGIGNAPALSRFHALVRSLPAVGDFVTLAVADGLALALLGRAVAPEPAATTSSDSARRGGAHRHRPDPRSRTARTPGDRRRPST